MLGAEEFGFATAPLVATGCILMRKCHLNTCPVGIATQDPELRRKFEGKPEHVIRFMFYVAEEARALMAQLGVRSLRELVGRTDLLQVVNGKDHWKTSRLDFSDILSATVPEANVGIVKSQEQDHGVERTLDVTLIDRTKAAIESSTPVAFTMPIRTVNRTVGAQLSGAVATKYGAAGLPPGTIKVQFTGIAGQSFGAFLAPGIEFSLVGNANDYVGKGLSGGTVSVRPDPTVTYVPENNVIAGNVLLYGATAGRAFFNGVVGERFCVRNSGATAVVEGVGEHGCEYMTGGTALVLGPTGKNFAAGMSGGIAFVLDEHKSFASRCNQGMVDLVSPEAADLNQIKALMEEHVARTESPLAKRLLADWSNTSKKFVKVFPREYRRVLEDRAKKATVVGAQATA
jgi:glutamate synthase domain-containing protein 3